MTDPGYAMKARKSILATLLFLVVLVSVYWCHVRFFKVDVLLYSAVTDAAIATIAAASILFSSHAFAPLGHHEKAQLCVIWLLTGYAFAISVPTVIDRSLSFYLLEKLQQRGGGIQRAAFEEIFAKEYVKEHHLADIRLTEQERSGTIKVVDGCVKLTERGARVATFSRFFRKYFLPRQRLVAGQYTDALVDPFRYSEVAPNYSCR